MFQEISYNYFKIPDSGFQDTQLLAVLDASGSMTTYWPLVAKYYNSICKQLKNFCAVTFDTKAKVVPQSQLTDNINTYGGGGTNITIAFQEVNKLLFSLKSKKNVTILFVSDGQGDYKAEFIEKTKPQIENLNFICIGVGAGFPTFISMSLRQMYHNGDNQIPPLFLVETLAHLDINANFGDEFLAAQKFLRHRSVVKSSPCYQFPWDNLIDQIWAGSWVLSYDEEIEIEQKEKQKLQKVKVQGEQVSEIASYWLQNLQLLSLKQKVSDQASIALKEIQKLATKKKLTFLERVKEQRSALNQLISELKYLASSQTLQELGDAAAAQRLRIGTQVGKFHQKALKFAGVSLEAFQTHKQEFLNMIKNTKFLDLNLPPSIITLQNQVDVLTDPELYEGFVNCETQYHLVSSLPIIGYGLYIKRTDQSRINPYAVDVISMPKINKYIDSISLIDAPNHTVEYGIGDDQKETMNCLLPLYNNEMMRPFLKSNVFHIQMTFVLMENADTCFDNAYAALLGNSLLYLICQEESQWKGEMIELINSSFMLAYSDHEKVSYHLEYLLKDPIGTMADENLANKTCCEDLSKTILMLNQIKNNFQADQFKEIIQRLIIEAICRQIKGQSFFQQTMEIEKNFQQNVIQDIITQFTDDQLEGITDFDQLRNKIQDIVDNINLQNIVSPFEFNKEKFLNAINQRKFTMDVLNSVYQYFLNDKVPENLLPVAAYHSRIEKSYERSKTPVEYDINKIQQDLLIRDLITQKRAEISQSIFNQLRIKCQNVLKQNKNSKLGKVPRVVRRRLRKQRLREEKEQLLKQVK